MPIHIMEVRKNHLSDIVSLGNVKGYENLSICVENAENYSLARFFQYIN